MTEDDRFGAFVRALDEDGFFIWRGLIDHADIDAHLAAYEAQAHGIDARYLKDKSPAGLPAHRAARDKFYSADSTHERICFDRGLLAFLRARFGAEPVLRMVGTHLFTVGSHLHADCLNTTATDPWEHELRMWCALEDVHPDAGPIYLYPKSHRLVSRTIREEMLAEKPGYRAMLRDNFKPYTPEAQAFGKHLIEKLEAGIAGHALPRIVPNLAKGDVLVFSPAIAHGTMPADNAALTRKCMIFNHYAHETPFYPPKSYWGAGHDFRSPATEVHFDECGTPAGLRVIRYLAACERLSAAK